MIAKPRRTGSNGGPRIAKGAVPKMAHERSADEMLDRPADDVDRDRIGADHQQRERPALPFQALDRGVKDRQHQDDEAAAIQGVGRRPDPLDDRVDVQPLKHQPEERQRDACDHEPLQLFCRSFANS